MKKYLKIACLLFVSALLFTCDDDNKLASPQDTIGWIQFPEPANQISVNPELQPSFNVGIDIQVPVVAQDLTITYDLVPVSGLDPNTVFSNNGVIVSPAGSSSYAGPDNNTGINYTYLANIEFDASSVPQLTELMVFDVVLKTTNDSNISVGLDGADKPISQRVVILCATNPDTIPSEYFVGDYTISDNVAQIGPGNGTENFGSGTVTLVVDPSNPNRRTFDVTILPAFTGGAPFSTSIVFSTQDESVTLGEFVGAGISCNGVTEYGFTSAAAADSGQWNICESSFIVVEYIEDPTGACNGPYASSFTLTSL